MHILPWTRNLPKVFLSSFENVAEVFVVGCPGHSLPAVSKHCTTMSAVITVIYK